MKQKLLLFIALFSFLGSSAWAQTFTQGSLRYTVTNATAKTVSVARANDGISGAIVIPSSVTYSNVTYTVTSVAEYGFQNTGISAMTIPASVEKIGFYAFQGTQSLTKLTIQDSATPIEFVTGYNLSFGTSRKELYIGRDINRTGDYAGERLLEMAEKVTIGPKVTTIPNNLLSGQDYMHTLVIGDGVKTIGEDAFSGDRYGTPELSVTFGANVESIGARAFQNSFALKSITLPSKLKTIGSNAFDGTYISSITIPASVTDIEQYAFYSCGQLTSINFEDSDEPVNFVTGYARSFGPSNKEVYIGRDINRTGDYFNEHMFDNVTKVTFGPKVTAIPNNFMSGQDRMHTLIIGDGVKTIGDDAFAGDRYGEPELSVTMGANVESIGARAFQTCFALKSITLPSKLKTIGSQAFESTEITSITIPASVTDIEYYAFRGCGQLTSIKFEDSNQPINFETGYERSFGGAAKEVYLGRDVNRTGDYAGERLFDNVTKVTFGPKFTEIGQNMFSGNRELTSIVIGSGVKTIGQSAFYNCGNLDNIEELKVTMGANVETLADYAFQYCTKLKSITIPSKVKAIGAQAFDGCGLTALTIPTNVTVINFYAFRDCNSLASINIEASTEPLEFVTGYTRSFGYNNPKTVFYGRNVIRTGDYVNERIFNKVTDLTIGDMVTEIPDYMFDGNVELQNATIGAGVKYIGLSAFYSCGTSEDVTELKVEMGVNVDSLAANAFYNCQKLKTINLPSTLKVIESSAFRGSGLTELYIPASVKRLGYYAFLDCNSLASINIEASNEPLEFVTAYSRSFGNAAKEVFVGRNINRTGDYTNERVFNNMTKLTIGDMVTEIGSNMFNGNNELKAVYVSWTQPITINTNVFNNATYQTATLYVPGGTKAKYAAATGWKNFYNVQAWSVIVKLTAAAHGTIKTKYGTASNGNTIQFNQPKDEPLVYTITADNGYKLSALTDNGTAVSPLPQLGVAQSRAINNSEESITLSATFAPVSYTISYDLAGGALASGVTNRTSYNIETATFTLNNPTRDHYDFTGWTGTGLNAPTKTVTIAKGSTGNRSYKATWEKATYTVTITGAGVTASNYSPKYGESVTITIADDPDRTLTSLTVNGTDVTSQVKNNKYTITNVSSNIEVVATFRSTKEFITLTGEYAMFSCPQDLDFSESNLCAYIVSGVNKNTHQVLMTRVFDVPAGTGLYLIGTPGQTYKIPYSESYSIYKNFLVANLTKGTVDATTGSYTNYAFGTEGGEPGFYPINGSTTLQAQTAYLQLPTSFVEAGVKMSIILEEDLIDGMIDMSDWSDLSDESDIYDIAGRRLGKMQKGINIVGGKKVLVK